jgi:RND family efflux transporter MFP subunit
MTDLVDTFEAGGIVQARTTATLTARILAPVREVRVTPGDRVRAGQVLVVLDGRDLGAHARSAKAAASGAAQGAAAAAAEEREAQASLALARATHERIATLQARRSATPQELDEATAGLRAAEAKAAGATARAQEAASGVDSARAASEAAGVTESFTRITSPFDGIVTQKMVEPGNMATSGTPLLRVEDTRGFRLDVRMDESRIGQIAPGSSVEVLLDSGAGGAALSVDGTVSEIGRAVDADARAFLVKVALPDTASVRSGMFGRARVAGAPRRVLTVPASAIVRRGQVTSVFVIDHGVARLRLVSLRDTQVLAGLSEGDRVILDPPADLADGTRVSEGGQ